MSLQEKVLYLYNYLYVIMTIQNIESELSYSYLHAVCSKAGLSCMQGDRHDDGAGVDAEIIYRGKLKYPYLTEVQ